jgi:hypothetical protein
MQNEYIYDKKTLLEQFKIFCDSNNPKNFEIAVEFFAIFGGLNRKIDCEKNLSEQIQEHILKRYRYLRDDIANISKGDELSHKVLSGIALGDRRTNSAFKRAKISFDDGIDIVDRQCEIGMLNLEKSLFRLTGIKKDMNISEKLIFTTPFAHFWFACVSPIFKNIKDGDFKESLQVFENKKIEIISFVYEQLCFELLKEIYKDDKIQIIGRYWDNTRNIIDILAQTKSKKIIAGSIKYTNNKIKKSALTQLQQDCTKLDIQVDTYVLFAKKGFSSELKSLKGEGLELYTIKHLSKLLG